MAAFSSDTNRKSMFVDTSRAAQTRRVGRWTAALSFCLFLGSLSGVARGGTLVNFNTQLGTIQVDLFDDLVPETVNNFLSYVNSGAYANTLVHRSTSLGDTGLAVIQGGGYTVTAPLTFTAIPKSSAIVLQYNRANSRGTIAMARTAAQNSATSEWFINTSDNSTTLGQSNGGGYAVFGWVVGNGMSIADTINTLPKQTVAGFQNVPLKNFTPPGTPTSSNLVLSNSITLGATHPSFQNPVMATDVVNDGKLRLTDAHALINDLLANGSHNVAGTFSGTKYLDVNGSNTVTLADAIVVINALLAQNPGAAAMAEPMASPLAAPMLMPMNVVPEPTTICLGVASALTIAAYAVARRRVARAARQAA